MTVQAWGVVVVLVALAAGVLGFIGGRRGGGDHRKVLRLEELVERQKEELEGYRREVDAHFDRTATLVGSIAGNYRELFDHLSSGYQKLSGGASRDLFAGRPDLMLSQPAAQPEPVEGPPEGPAAHHGAARTEAEAPAPADESAHARSCAEARPDDWREDDDKVRRL